MINTVVIDSNIRSRDVLLNNLKSIEDINVISVTEEFPEKIEPYQEANLVIFDISSQNADKILEKIAFLKTRSDKLKFIATSYEINSSLVNTTLKQGVDDFLLKPILQGALEASIRKTVQVEKKLAETVCVFSNKGGSGKTTTVINVAYELWKQTKKRVCILDLSFSSENVSTFLNVDIRYDIDYILSKIEQSSEQLLLSLMGRYKESKIYMLEAKDNLTSDVNYTPQNIAKIINSLKNIFDYIVIDTSGIISELNVSIFSNSDLILLLANSSLVSVRNCEKCYEIFDKINYDNDKIKLIINRYIENQEVNVELIERNLNRKVFSTIPNNYLTLIDAINSGHCVGEVNPKSNVAKAYSKIAEGILNIDMKNLNSKKAYNHGIFNLLRRMGE